MLMQNFRKRKVMWHLIPLLALIVITIISTKIAAFDANSYNEDQLKKLSEGDHTVIGVHGVCSYATNMQSRVEALIRMGSGHNKAISFEYRRREYILPTPFWVFSSDDNMHLYTTERAGAKLAVFIAQVKHKTGRPPDVLAHSQGSTILVKAARWIALIQEAIRKGEDVAKYLKSFGEWGRLSPNEQQLLLDNIPLLQQASIGTAIVAGSPTNVLDPAWEYLEQVVENKTPSGQPAAFYIYSDTDWVSKWLSNFPISLFRVRGPRAFSEEQSIFIGGIDHNDYFNQSMLGLGLIADLFKHRHLPASTEMLLKEHNRTYKSKSDSYESGSDSYWGWVEVKPRGFLEYVPIRKVRPGIMGMPGEPMDALVQEIVTRATKDKKPGKPPHVLLYGDGRVVDAVASQLEERGITVTKCYGPMSSEAIHIAAARALECGADLGVALGSVDEDLSIVLPDNANWWSSRLNPHPFYPPFYPPPRPVPAGGVATYTLSEAIQKGMVECIGAVVTDDNGNVRGILRLRKRTNDNFRVIIPAGTVLKSDDPHSQSLVTW